MKAKWFFTATAFAAALLLFSDPGFVPLALGLASPVYAQEASSGEEEALADAESMLQETEGMLKPPGEGQEGASASIFTPSVQEGEISWDPAWPYASYSQIHSGTAFLYKAADGRGITVCVNAGHGTRGGSSLQTLCHPDGTPKVTGGSTAQGAVYATAVSEGTTMMDGTPEAEVTLSLARILKEELLAEGFHVLMIRDDEDVQLDNIARTVLANENADCHLALHYDSTDTDKGFFFISVPDISSYRSMEPVASHYQQHMSLGRCIAAGEQEEGISLYGTGDLALDLTQTSYSTIPSVDLECGDRASDWSEASQRRIAKGIVRGIKAYFDE